MAQAGEQHPVEQHGAPHHGTMPVTAQRSSYVFFNTLVHWCATGVAALVAFLTLWLCAHVAFLGALIVAIVIIAGGAWMNRSTGHNAGY